MGCLLPCYGILSQLSGRLLVKVRCLLAARIRNIVMLYSKKGIDRKARPRGASSQLRLEQDLPDACTAEIRIKHAPTSCMLNEMRHTCTRKFHR